MRGVSEMTEVDFFGDGFEVGCQVAVLSLESATESAIMIDPIWSPGDRDENEKTFEIEGIGRLFTSSFVCARDMDDDDDDDDDFFYDDDDDDDDDDDEPGDDLDDLDDDDDVSEDDDLD